MIPASYYAPIFLYTVVILSLLLCAKLSSKSYKRILHDDSNFAPALVLAMSMAIFLGMRPINGYYFVDTANYAQFYRMYASGAWTAPHDGEFLFNQFMQSCSAIMDVHGFFSIVDIMYFGFTLWACRRFFPNNPLAGLLFNLGAFSFYSYGVNGIRNGLACSIVLIALSYLTGNKRDKIIGAALGFIAINIHRTTMLPIGIALISTFFIKSFKTAYIFWILSIIISLVAGNSVSLFFATLGFDDRLSYLSGNASDGFSRTGFRWDFLCYSMMPILLGYYVIIKRGIRNATYEFLLNTYTLSNAFWIMVIRASFSNRFAYLSWFMFPMVLAYPVLRMNIWGEQQGKFLSRIMLAQLFFTWFMKTIYY